MLRSMTVRQFNEWRAYGELEPFDETRADLRSAQVTQALLNLLGRGKRGKAFPLSDCLLRFGAEASVGTDHEREKIGAQVMGVMSTLIAASAQAKGQ
jgi:hypothetical protein